MSKYLFVKYLLISKQTGTQVELFKKLIFGGSIWGVLGGGTQRWSPRGRSWPQGHPREQILKSLDLASKVKSLASRPQVLENWPVLNSRTALFFELLKFCEALENFFGKRFFVEITWKIFVKTFFFYGDRLKNFCEDLFFMESTCACVLGPWPWPRAFLSLASRVFVLGEAVLGLGLEFFCVLGLGLEPYLLDSTSGGTPKLGQNICLLNIYWYHKTLAL